MVSCFCIASVIALISVDLRLADWERGETAHSAEQIQTHDRVPRRLLPSSLFPVRSSIHMLCSTYSERLS